MALFRRVYLDVSTGDYHALFLGQNIKPHKVEGTFSGVVEIVHSMGTDNLVITCYNAEGEEIHADEVEVTSTDTVSVTFAEEFTGHISLLFF